MALQTMKHILGLSSNQCITYLDYLLINECCIPILVSDVIYIVIL